MHGSYTVAASLTFQISQMFDNFWMQNHSKCHPAIADNHCDFSQHSTKLLRNSLSAMAEGSGRFAVALEDYFHIVIGSRYGLRDNSGGGVQPFYQVVVSASVKNNPPRAVTG